MLWGRRMGATNPCSVSEHMQQNSRGSGTRRGKGGSDSHILAVREGYFVTHHSVNMTRSEVTL